MPQITTLNSVSFNYITSEKIIKKILCHRHWERMGVDPKVLPFLYIFCIECYRKSLKFDTFAKIKVTSVLEIYVSLRYAMYIHMICKKK